MDLITYVEDIQEMYSEGVAIASDENSPLKGLFTVDDDGTLSFMVTKIPVTYTKDGKSLCLCRGVVRETIELSTSIKVLGECINNEYIFDSQESRDIYESVYDTTTRTIDDGEGGSTVYTPPYIMGVFA